MPIYEPLNLPFIFNRFMFLRLKLLEYWACIGLGSIIIPNCADCYQSYLSSKISLAKLLCLTVSVSLAEFFMFLLSLITFCSLLFLVLFTCFSKEPQKANCFTRKAVHLRIAIVSVLLQIMVSYQNLQSTLQ